MLSEVVLYHHVCPTHGLVASAEVPRRLEPQTMRCRVCGQQAELWIGATPRDRRRSPS